MNLGRKSAPARSLGDQHQHLCGLTVEGPPANILVLHFALLDTAYGDGYVITVRQRLCQDFL